MTQPATTYPANIHPANIHDTKRPEPSMEDILASIRHIVADNERSGDAVLPDTRSANAPVTAVPHENPALAAPPAVDTFTSAAANAGRRADMDALLAELEASERQASEAGYAADAVDARQEQGEQDHDVSEPVLSQGAAQDGEPPDDDVAAQSADLERDILELTEEMAKRVNVPEHRATETGIQHAAPEHGDTHSQDTRSPALGGIDAEALAQPILSQSAASAVEAAFNSLASTVLSDNARPLEDLVREMLRPMLKSWLDDNLPGIAERAVRAEIERVARGR